MNMRFKFLSVKRRKKYMKKQDEMLAKTDEALGIVLFRAKRAEQERDEIEDRREETLAMCAQLKKENDQLKEALNALYLLVKHETNLPDSAANGVTDPGGSLDEGVTRAAETMETVRRLIKVSEGDGVKEKQKDQIEYEMFWGIDWLTSDANSLRDMFEGLEIASKNLQALHEDGIRLDPKSTVKNDCVRLVTTDPEIAEKYKMGKVEREEE